MDITHIDDGTSSKLNDSDAANPSESLFSFRKEVNRLDWDFDNCRWEFEVTVPNKDLSIVEVIMRRISCDGNTVKASKSSGLIAESLGVTGSKIGIVSWNDGTQNPDNRARDDKLEIVFRIHDTSNNTQNAAGNKRATSVHALIDNSHIYEVGRLVGKTAINVNASLKYITKSAWIKDALRSKQNGPLLIYRFNATIYNLIRNQKDNGTKRAHVSLITHVKSYHLSDVLKRSSVFVINHISQLANYVRMALNETSTHEPKRSSDHVTTELTHVGQDATSNEMKEIFDKELREAFELSHLSSILKSVRKEVLTSESSQIPTLTEGSQPSLRRLKNLELENLTLKQELWKLKYRGTRGISIILILIGGVSLAVSYAYSSLILTFIGLGLLLWGIVILYVSRARQVPEEVIDAISFHAIKAFDEVLLKMGLHGKIVFLYKNLAGVAKGYMLVPYGGVDTEAGTENRLSANRVDITKGMYIEAPAQGLVELFERELNINLADVDLEYVQENLPVLLTEDLKLVDSFSIERKDNIVRMNAKGRLSSYICDLVKKQTHLGDHLGCPLCGAIALVISKVTGRPVSIRESSVKGNYIETSYALLDN
ncbi:MAG: hypothetical protein QXU32_02640 [Nitrososphaerales archaeon]